MSASQDLRHRASGRAVELRHALSLLQDEPVADDLLAERARAVLGHAVSHPRSINVIVREGVIHLVGTILRAELRSVIRAMRGVRGSRGLVNELHAVDSARGIPELQGEGGRAAAHRRAWARMGPVWAVALAAASGLAAYWLVAIGLGGGRWARTVIRLEEYPSDWEAA